MKLKLHPCLITGEEGLCPGPFDSFGKGSISTDPFILHLCGVGGAGSCQAAPANKALA